jgi:hypothetical protein
VTDNYKTNNQTRWFLVALQDKSCLNPKVPRSKRFGSKSAVWSSSAGRIWQTILVDPRMSVRPSVFWVQGATILHGSKIRAHSDSGRAFFVHMKYPWNTVVVLTVSDGVCAFSACWIHALTLRLDTYNHWVSIVHEYDPVVCM